MSRLQHTLRRAGAGVVALRTARTHPQRPVPVEVAKVVDLTRSMRRITFTGPGLAGFPVLGNDHYARLLLPRGAELVLPKTERWYPELLAMDPAVRPWLRNYTLRHVRPGDREVDVDFVLHGGGPAALWAAGAGAGDVAGLDTSHFLGQAHFRGKPKQRRVASEVLVVRSPGSTRVKRELLKRAMTESGVPYECACCGLTPHWQGQTLTLAVDHINGDWLDNRLANLRFLCPNCHSQTSTWCRRKGAVFQ